MNYCTEDMFRCQKCGTLSFDDDCEECYRKEKIKKYIREEQQTTSEVTAPDDGVLCLGLRTPVSRKIHPWAYFITLAFPTRHAFKIKHVEIRAQGAPRIVFSPIKYGDCTQSEQYEWLMFQLRKHINVVCDYYDVFFEQTKEGNVHIHARIGYDGKKKTMKDIRALFHRIFECPTHYRVFCDIKEYNDSKWNDYQDKRVKVYQTLDYEHFKNI